MRWGGPQLRPRDGAAVVCEAEALAVVGPGRSGVGVFGFYSLLESQAVQEPNGVRVTFLGARASRPRSQEQPVRRQ